MSEMDVQPPTGIHESLLKSDGNGDEEKQPESAKSVRSKGTSFSLWLGPFFVRNLIEACFLPSSSSVLSVLCVLLHIVSTVS